MYAGGKLSKVILADTVFACQWQTVNQWKSLGEKVTKKGCTQSLSVRSSVKIMEFENRRAEIRFWIKLS
jgi:hypothetical protein